MSKDAHTPDAAPNSEPSNPTQIVVDPEIDTSGSLPPTPELSPDPDAPYGRKADGTPRAKPGRKRVEDTQVDRLLSVTPAKPRVKPSQSMPPTAAIVTDYEALGKTAAGLWFGVGTLIFGDDWQPDTEQKENVVIKDAFRDYFKDAGFTTFPPGVALVIALGTYAAVRTTKPTVKSRIGAFVSWIKSKMPRR